MDRYSPLVKRLLKGFGAQGFGKVLLTIQRVVEVPLLLKFWQTNLYGEWLVISAIPNYLSITDGGFTISGMREMSARSAAGDKDGANRVFQSLLVLLFFISIGMVILMAILLPVLPLQQWLSLSEILPAGIMFVFVLDVLTGFYQALFSGAFWCEGNYPRGMGIINAFSFVRFITFIVVVMLGGTPLAGAFSMLVVRVISTIVMGTSLKITLPWVEFGYKYASIQEIKKLLSPSVASILIPLGRALNIQGLRLIVGSVMGPAAVVTFATLRTLARATMQIRSMVDQVAMPEISTAYGKGDLPLARKLLLNSTQAAFWLVGVSSVFLGVFGGLIIRLWTGGQVEMDWTLYLAMLAAGVVNAFWNSAVVILAATNQHQRVAVMYNLVYGLLTCALAYVCAKYFGLIGIALILILSEGFTALFVLPQVVSVSQVPFTSLVLHMLVPPVLNIRKLLNPLINRL